VSAPVLAVEGLCIAAPADGGWKRVVDDVSLTVAPGEIVALVGESGSGKTMIGRAALRLLPPGLRIETGALHVDGQDVTTLDEAQMRPLRGAAVGMVFQEPMVSLNPALSIGFQVTEALRLHQGLKAEAAKARALEMFRKVRIADPEASFRAYPHQFSGGMRQRIMIASVLAMRPKLLIADEPTTALDAIIRKEVMDLMVGLARESGTAVLLISHDLGMVAQYADRVVVLQRGRLIETGGAQEILLRPRDPYTQALLGALPLRGETPPPKAREPLLEIDGVCVDFRGKPSAIWRRPPVKRAVDAASLTVFRGETLALVGESGSGKTTLGRAVVRLVKESEGRIRFDGRDLAGLKGRGLVDYRRRIQMVFQDPFSSLDPRMSLGDLVDEGLRHTGAGSLERRERARAMLAEVGLPGDYVDRFPHELSGGQRQRVCIARAVVAQPELIVADEPVSALDVTIQHQVLELMSRLQATYRFTYLFVSHDLGVVEQVADRVAVMFHGRLLEVGPRDAIFDAPRHPYTRRLLEATPRLQRRPGGGYELAPFTGDLCDPPAGLECFNHGSIPGAPLSVGAAEMVEVAPGHLVCCARREAVSA
jgi:peptide/nickel transport system ATP-binding protein